MRALLYADWCTIRSMLVRYLGICLLVIVPLVIMSNEGGSGAPGVFAGAMFTAMFLFYVLLNLFNTDEAADWEQMRLTLPVTPRLVVRERYAFLMLVGLGTAALGTLAGVMANAVLYALAMLTVPRGPLEVLAGSFGAAAVALGYFSLIVPYIFKVGMTKARISFSLPMFLPLLLNIKPVGDAAAKLINGLEGMSRILGSPAPIIAALVAAIALVFLASMLLSERIYEARDF